MKRSTCKMKLRKKNRVKRSTGGSTNLTIVSGKRGIIQRRSKGRNDSSLKSGGFGRASDRPKSSEVHRESSPHGFPPEFRLGIGMRSEVASASVRNDIS